MEPRHYRIAKAWTIFWEQRTERNFARFYKSSKQFVKKIVRKFTLDQDVQEDMVSIIYTKFNSNVHLFMRARAYNDPIEYAISWLTTIARNTCIDEIRRIQRIDTVEVKKTTVMDMSTDEWLSMIPKTAVENLVYKEEAEDIILTLLDYIRETIEGQIPKDSYEMLLQEANGSSYNDIARTFGNTMSQVKTKIYVARRQLRLIADDFLKKNNEYYENFRFYKIQATACAGNKVR